MNKRIPICFFLALSGIFALSSCGGDSSSTLTSTDSSGVKQPEVRDPQGTYGVLQQMRKSQGRVALPGQGDANILVVPVQFVGDEDNGFAFNKYTLSSIYSAFFGNLEEYPSVCSYYEQSSFDKLHLGGVRAGVVTAPLSIAEAILKTVNYGASSVHEEILSAIYDYYFVETSTYQVADFDADKDGKVDAIELVYDFSYSYSWDSDTYASAGQSLMIPTVAFSSDYSAANASLPVNSYGSSSVEFVANGTSSYPHAFIGLVGQQIGIDDYSDTTGDASSNVRAPLAYLDPEAGFVGDQNPFTKYQLGWIEPKFLNAASLTDDSQTLTLAPSITSGESLILSCSSEAQAFGEYLIIDYYTPTGINEYDSFNSSLYGRQLFDQKGIRVYKVDSRLVRGYGSSVLAYEGEPDFTATKTLDNGQTVSYFYDYGYTNNGINDYSSLGLSANFPLVEILSKKGANRHMTSQSISLTSADLFLQGDQFGSEDQIEGFYRDFAFDSDGYNGEVLGISFSVDSLTDDAATLTVKRS